MNVTKISRYRLIMILNVSIRFCGKEKFEKKSGKYRLCQICRKNYYSNSSVMNLNLFRILWNNITKFGINYSFALYFESPCMRRDYSWHRLLFKDCRAHNTGCTHPNKRKKIYLRPVRESRSARWHRRRSITWICDFVRTRVKSQCRHISSRAAIVSDGQVCADRIVCNIVSQEGQAY